MKQDQSLSLLVLLIILIIVFIIVVSNYLCKKVPYKVISDNPYIPKTIWITYKTKKVPDKVISNWRKLNPEYNIEFLDHDDVYKYLLENYSRDDAEYYKSMPYGSIKGDIFRLYMLYQYGGCYSDVDNHPLVPIKDFLPSDVQFCSVYNKPNDRIACAFIATTPHNPIIEEALRDMISRLKKRKEYKDGKIKCPWGKGKENKYFWGPIIWADALKKYLNVKKLRSGMIETPEQRIYLLDQICPPSNPHFGCYFTDDSGKKLMMARYPDYGKTW